MSRNLFKIHSAIVISINNIPAITHVQILHGDSHFQASRHAA